MLIQSQCSVKVRLSATEAVTFDLHRALAQSLSDLLQRCEDTAPPGGRIELSHVRLVHVEDAHVQS